MNNTLTLGGPRYSWLRTNDEGCSTGSLCCLNTKSITSSSRYFESPSIILSAFNNKIKKRNRTMFYGSFWVTVPLPKIFLFFHLLKCVLKKRKSS